MESPNIISNLAEKDEVYEACYGNLITFGRFFLPKDFRKTETPPFHFEMAEHLLTTEPGARVCHIVPRGFGKSILAKATILHKICYKQKEDKNFIAWISEAGDQAEGHVKYIKHHLESNQRIQEYFGDFCGERTGETWTKRDIVTTTGDRILARGTTQKLRGRTELDVRFTGIVLDDFESELNTKTPERRLENKNWLISTVYAAMEETPGKEGWVWLQGTIVHYDSYLQSILDGWREALEEKKPYRWNMSFYQATDTGTLDGKSIWPSLWPITKLQQRRDGEFAGAPDRFAQEYFNDAFDLSRAPFKVNRVNTYHGSLVVKSGFSYLHIKKDYIPVFIYMGVDLASLAKATSDKQAITVMAIDAEKNRYLIDMFYDRIPIEDMPPKIVLMATQYMPLRRVTIETVQAQEMVKGMAVRLSKREKKLVPGIFRGYKPPPGIKKEDRLAQALCPWVNSGKLYIKDEHSELLDEMLRFPKPGHDDLLDSLFLSNLYAQQRFPKSNRITEDEFGELEEEDEKISGKARRAYDWISGALK